MDLTVPFLLDTDSYKCTHWQMYPSAREMTAYFTCRGPLYEHDHRIVFAGFRYLFETVIARRITWDDIHEADTYLETHGVAKSRFNWPRDLWISVIEENDGHLPFEIRALRDGSVIYPQVPCFTITARGKYARLVTWFETALMRIWSPIVTATKSRHVWDGLRKAFELSVDDECMFLLASRLHDFGSRGVSSAETAMTTGLGHLLSFEGTDTMTAGWLATVFNNGKPIGESVIASEHSVMTSWEGELDAIKRLIDITPDGAILSCVADSYSYGRFLREYLPIIAPLTKAKNILFVIRPDSGDPVQAVLQGLRAAEYAFGATRNKKGYKVLDGAAIIQGDGIDAEVITQITKQVLHNGYAIQNVAFGMGGGLLQKQNRDTLKVAMKLCHIVDADGNERCVMKAPSDDAGKASLPGLFSVCRIMGVPFIYPRARDERIEFDELEVVWNSGPVNYQFDTFDDWRARLNRQWESASPKVHVFSGEMNAVREREFAKIRDGQH